MANSWCSPGPPARDPYYPGQKASEFANDPNETQIQYDLYRIPFNDGKGGKPEPIAGASDNGMSNDFPKVSPDGKWIVFVQNKTGLLMRPDSKLYIVPAAGGVARPLRSNQPVMNSWHSFSPNGRWLVFSSKTPSPYTRLYLTHIDADGNSTPAIPIENATAANRAVNIPEFVNIAAGRSGAHRCARHRVLPALRRSRATGEEERIRRRPFRPGERPWNWRRTTPARTTTSASRWRRRERSTKPSRSIGKSLELDPRSSQTNNNLGSVLAQAGQNGRKPSTYFERALELDPENPRAHNNLGGALAEKRAPAGSHRAFAEGGRNRARPGGRA